MTDHERFMTRAYALAEQAAANGDHPFSALLVVDGEIVQECLNTVVSNHDATRHPELDILRQAASQDPAFPFEKATLYASTEPCAMCTGAIFWSGISTIVFGCSAVRLGQIKTGRFVVESRNLLSHGNRPVDVIGPVLPEQGEAIHRAFWN